MWGTKTGITGGRTGRIAQATRGASAWARSRLRVLPTLLCVSTLLVVVACSGADNAAGGSDAAESADSGTAYGEGAAVGDAEEPATERPSSPAAGDEAHSVVPVNAGIGRRIVRTAQLELEVEDAARAADEIGDIAAHAGGFVSETDLERDAEGTVRGSITLRVPSAALFATVEELDALAVAVPIRRIDELDVTAESTDLEARLTNLTAYESELRQLLSDVRETTTRPDDLLTVFERIRSVRAEIDQAEARLAVLDDQVALSTIRVSLRPAASAVPVADPTWSPSETVRDALSTTARTLSVIADGAIRFTLTALPIGLLLGAPIVATVVVWRRVRPGPPASAAPGNPPEPTPS